MARLRAGRCQVVVIEGEAGIGKTRLLEEVLQGAGDARVFTADAEQLEQTRPFGPLTDALGLWMSSPDPQRAEISHLISDGGAEFRVVECIAELIQRLGLGGATIVAIDDLQWADPSTVTCLRYAARHLADVPVAFLVAMRPVPRSEELARFVDASVRDGAEHWDLGPLDEASVVGLVEDRVGAPAGPRLRTLVGSAGGNPFYAIELVDALAAEHRLGDAAGDWVDIGDATIPAGFRTNLLRYLRFLSRRGLALLQKAAVLGAHFSLADLAAFAGEPAHSLLPIVDEAQRVGILAESGEHLVFRHDLLREAIYDDMPISVRRALHLEAGWALAGAHAAPDRVAPHFMIGAQVGDGTAVEWMVAAGAVATNNLTRAELLAKVVELLPDTDGQLATVGAEAVVSLNRAGRPAEAERFAETLRPRLDRCGIGELEVALAAACIERVDPARALDHVEMAKPLESVLPPRLQAELLAYEAWTRFLTGAVEQGVTLAADAVEAGRKALAPIAVVIGLVTLSWSAICQRRAQDAVSLARQAVAQRPAELGQAVPEIHLQVALLHEDRFAEAEDVYQSAHERCVDEGRVPGQAVLLVIHALALLHQGRLDDAHAEAEASLTLCEELGSPITAAASRSVIGRVALHRGALAEAERVLGPPPASALGADWQLWAAALVQEARGDTTAARNLLQLSWVGLGAMRYFVSWLFIGPDLCRLSVRLDDRAHAEEVAQVVATGAAGSTSQSATGAALRCRGLVDGNPEAMLAAVAAYECSPRVLETARTREEAAAVLGSPDAVEQLTAALATYDAAGADGDAARVRAALRARGVRLGTRGERHRPVTGWGSLTPSEQRVVRLASEGLTNRQIGDRLYISSLTVGSHLRSVYRKLGINTRVRLAAEAARHGDALHTKSR